MIKTKELFDEAVSLPVEIRAQLIDKLLQSIHPDFDVFLRQQET